MPWAKIVAMGAKALLKEDKNGKRKGLYLLIGLLIVPFLIPVLAISLPGMFGKDSEDELDRTFELENSKVYQQVTKEYSRFKSAVDNRIQAQIQEMKSADEAENSEQNTSSSKGQQQVKAVRAIHPETNSLSLGTESIATSSVSPEIINYALAYLMNKYTDIQTREESIFFLKKIGNEISNFFESITSVKVWREGNAPNITYHSQVRILSASKVGQKYFPNAPDQFETSYLAFGGMIGLSSQSGSSDVSNSIGELKYPESGMPIPHFKQGGDSPWANHIYGSGPMSQTACGPTSMAMIISYLTGNTISPAVIADWSMSHGYYVWGAGTSWSFYTAVAKEYGLTSTQISVTAESISSHLKAGHPIIASMTPGVFTKYGHFIVLRGITPEGKILVNDPNDNPSKNFFNKEFDISLIVSQCKGAWAFTK